MEERSKGGGTGGHGGGGATGSGGSASGGGAKLVAGAPAGALDGVRAEVGGDSKAPDTAIEEASPALW